MKKVERTRFKDEKGRYIVQGLFLEDRYNTDLAVYTYDGEDKEYKGVIYPSLKKRYIDHADPIEYDFATAHLFDWNHWQRLCNNSLVSKHIEEWREELRLKLASDGIQLLQEMANDGKSYQAAKYLADGGWVIQKVGRPSKEDIDGELKKRADEASVYNADIALLSEHKKKVK